MIAVGGANLSDGSFGLRILLRGQSPQIAGELILWPLQ